MRARTGSGPRTSRAGTLTFTNAGSRGALFDTPVINRAGMSRSPRHGIRREATGYHRDLHLGETIAVRDMVCLALTYDHRIAAGAIAASYLTEV